MGQVLKKYFIQSSPKIVFEALTNKNHVEAWTGDSAKMNDRSGSKFSLWGGSIHGVNVEVAPECIIQDWKEEAWEVYSKVTLLIRDKSGGTELELIHDHIPDDSVSSIDNGWDEYYLGPLKDYVESL